MVETLGDAWNLGWRVTMRCTWGKRVKSRRECKFRRELDGNFGLHADRNFPLDLVASRLMCPQCRSNRVAVMLLPPSTGARAAATGG
jgi:hypothetical protein